MIAMFVLAILCLEQLLDKNNREKDIYVGAAVKDKPCYKRIDENRK
jgi:hypothetical protein